MNNKQKTINYTNDLLEEKITDRQKLMLVKRKLSKKYNISILKNSEILKEINNLKLQNKKIKNFAFLQNLLRKRSIRTISGIAPVAVLTKPFPCPGKCVYCPTEKNVPQSYLSNEPAVMRAIRCKYNPYKQVQDRLKALEINGHNPEKIELIVIGGTWSVLPIKYQYWYILNLFQGANNFNTKKQTKIKANLSIEKLKKLLALEQKKNETAKYKIIGLTLETRPDYIDEKELWLMREFGCTRVELGVQAIDDKILKLNKRGHGVLEIINATSLLRKFGFKITYHLMPGLPGSTPAKDLKMFKKLFTDKHFQPDQIKFYPTVVTKSSLLYRWYKTGKYKPYTDTQLQKLIISCKKIVPSYVRIIRLIRDIPSESIIAGNKITNLRQIMKDKGAVCSCIRCREAKEKKLKIKDVKFNIINYPTTDGEEYFLSFDSKNKKTLYGFCRLQLLKNSDAIIRELHVYGELVPTGEKKKTQHAGLGLKLLKQAEKIAKKNKFKKISVISGIGVRNYYRKFGYKLKNTYLMKNL